MPASKGNKYAKGNRGGGHPTLYKPKHAEIAGRMCAKGATRFDLADRFGVNVSTIDAWIFEHEVFSQACKAGRNEADDRVERALYERAVGYTYDSEKIMVVNGKVVRVPIRVHIPPDIRAGEFWLRNRRPDRWKDGKQLEAKVVEDDPFLVYLKSINGCVMRPIEPPTAEAEYQDVTPERERTKADHHHDARQKMVRRSYTPPARSGISDGRTK